jgi:hypothetical protein
VLFAGACAFLANTQARSSGLARSRIRRQRETRVRISSVFHSGSVRVLPDDGAVGEIVRIP